MGFENKKEFRNILLTVKELLKEKGEEELIKILNDSELSIGLNGYDGWNGEINYYILYITTNVPTFIKLQSYNIETIEQHILEMFQCATRAIENEAFSHVLIAPKSSFKIDWSLLDKISKEDLQKNIEYLRNVMVAVATGGRIQEAEEEYKLIYKKVSSALKILDIENPNPYRSLWDWYGKWRNDFPTYQERRNYIREMYDSIISLFTESENERIVDVKVNLTDWDKIKRGVTEIKKREIQASTEEQFQAVGMLCREIIITLAQSVYVPELHPSTDGTEIGNTDAKRMLDAYIAVLLGGKESEELRAYAKTTNKLANALTHKRTATKKEMLLCTSATFALINFIGVLEDKL